MNIRNCRECGKIFNYLTGAPICPACKDKLEEKFQVVKEYIRAHPGVGIAQVAEDCDVDSAHIRQWLREERLEVTEDSPMYLSCDGCGAPIRSGKFCEKCKMDVSKGFGNMLKSQKAVAPKQEKPSSNDNARMRFLK